MNKNNKDETLELDNDLVDFPYWKVVEDYIESLPIEPELEFDVEIPEPFI